MSKLEMLEELQQDISDLQQELELIPAKIQTIEQCSRNKDFLDTLSIQELYKVFEKITGMQEDIYRRCGEAKIKEIPVNTDKALEQVTSIAERLKARRSYLEAQTFWSQLHANEITLEKFIRSADEEIQKYDLETLEDDDILQKLTKYVAFHKAYATEEKSQRFNCILEIGKSMPGELLFAMLETPNMFYTDVAASIIDTIKQELEANNEPLVVPDRVETASKADLQKVESVVVTAQEKQQISAFSKEKDIKISAATDKKESVATIVEAEKNSPITVTSETRQNSSQETVVNSWENETVKISKIEEPIQKNEEPAVEINSSVAFSLQNNSILIKDAVSKKEAGSFTINKFKIEVKGYDISLYTKIYRTLDKNAYITLDDNGLSPEQQEELLLILKKQVKIGYLNKFTIEGHTSYYCLAAKGSQAIKDGSFRGFLDLGKNKKRPDIHLVRDYNPFNLTSFIEINELVKASMNADLYDEFTVINNNSFAAKYIPFDDTYPSVRIVGVTDIKVAEFNKVKNNFKEIRKDREIIILAGLKKSCAHEAASWTVNLLGNAIDKNSIYLYDAAEQKLSSFISGEVIEDFDCIYKSYIIKKPITADISDDVPEESAEIAIAEEAGKDVSLATETQDNAEFQSEEENVQDKEKNAIPEQALITETAVEPVIDSNPDKEKKTSTTKEFKKMLEVNAIRAMISVMAYNEYFVHPEIVSGFAQKPLEKCEFEMGILVNAGLMRKITYPGSESFYTISPKAELLLKNASVKTYLRLEKYPNRKDERLSEKHEHVKPLVIKGYLDLEKFIAKETRYKECFVSLDLHEESFVKMSINKGSLLKFATAGLYTDNLEVFDSFAKELSNAVDSSIFTIISVLNEEHAAGMALWLNQILDETQRSRIVYKLVEKNTLYTLDGTEIINCSLTDLLQEMSEKLDKRIAELETSLGNFSAAEENTVETVVQAKTEQKESAATSEKIQREAAAVKASPVESKQDSSDEHPAVPLDNFVLDHPDKEQYLKNFRKMLSKGKIYAACAYLKAFSDQDKSCLPLYKQLAYAAGDPLGNCAYTSQVVGDVYFGCDEYDPQLLISAAIRNFYFDYYSYDYGINQLWDTLQGVEIFEECGSLKFILEELAHYKLEHNCGLDCYADYRMSNNSAIDKEIKDLRSYAGEQYNHYFTKFTEDIANRRFSEARKYVLDKEGPLGKALRAVIDGQDDVSTMHEIKEYLKETFISEGASIRKENISRTKIEALLDLAWNKAAEHMNAVVKTSDLMSALRQKFYNQVDRLVTPICDYVELNESKVPVDDPKASLAYKKLRTKLLKNIGEAISFAEKAYENGQETAGVLLGTLKELETRLNGSYVVGTEKYFYLDFLKTDNVLLDNKYLPYLNEIDETLPAISVMRRIEKHLSSVEKPLEKRAKEILEAEDNYSSLNCILEYLDSLKPGYADKFYKEKSYNLSLENAAEQLDSYREEFENDIELRQSYGQIDETEENKKEKLLKIVDYWYEWAKENRNYGFFRKVCNALIEKIEDDAVPRGKQLEKALEKFVQNNPDKLEDANNENAVNTVKERIRIKNYAAAEDLLNRLIAEDIIPPKDIIETDYLQYFIRDYGACYQDVASMRVNFKNLLLGRAPNNKDGKAANHLVESWMNRPDDCTPERVKALLTGLDFAVGSVTERPKIGTAKVFDITLARPEDGRKVRYKHPIAAFGSMAETEPFRAIFLFGNFEVVTLLEIFKNIGDAQHNLIFMDGALPLSARKTLARKTKEDTGKIFAVIDRVVLAYLHRNYKQAIIQQMLMSIVIPYAFYQPYVADSFVMPPEIFIGREEELKQIESAGGVNIVYGGRQLGKSAMLRMAMNDIDRNERGDRAVYVDIVGLDYKAACKKVCMILQEDAILPEAELTEDWAELSHRLRVRLKSEEERIPYLLLLLDEADEFIRTAADVNYQPLENLRDVQSIGLNRFKFVFAGLRDVIRFDRNQALSNNSVMTKLPKLTVKPFDANEARLLLEQPLSYLGFRFAKNEETESLIASIFSATNYFPGLLQLYCTNLVKALQKPDYAGYDEIDTPPYNVSVEHIKKVLGGKELQNQIRDKFFITLQLGDKEDKYYYIIALFIALQHHRDAENSDVTPEMLLDLAKEYSVKRIADMDEQKAYALMEELCELNILHPSGKGYRFTRYSFYQMMGSLNHIENELLNYLED